jgi:hypothetical protein
VVSGPTLPYPGWGENTVTVPARYFEEGRLPGVCVVTGAPATSNVRRHFSTTPGWVGCLFFVNFFAWLIAIAATRHSAMGDLPVCTAVAEQMRREHVDAVWLTSVGLVALIAIIPAAMALSSSGVAPFVCLPLAAGGVVALIGSAIAGHREAATLGIQGRVVQDGFGERWVQLRGVHPAFSRALAARLGR